ncbi:MAG: hypothetical protein Q9162_004613 [Coniocarpon cinnabarinum]
MGADGKPIHDLTTAARRDRTLKFSLWAAGIFFILATFVYYNRGTIEANMPGYIHSGPEPAPPLEYSLVAGYFQQDDTRTQDWVFDFTQSNFGLVTESLGNGASMTPWQSFDEFLSSLNKNANKGETFRLLFIGRAAESKHNVASGKYGPPDFDNFKSRHPGDAQFNWTDPQITTRGKVQTERNNAFMAQQLSEQKMPAPQSYYVSPLARTLDTAKKTFSTLDLPLDRPFRPVVKEDLRETHGIRMCDKRSSKTWISENFPNYRIEDGFPDDDLRWDANWRETPDDHRARTWRFMNEVFENDKSTYISFTAHIGSIRTIMEIVGHRDWPIKMGEMMPMLIRARPPQPAEQDDQQQQQQQQQQQEAQQAAQ